MPYQIFLSWQADTPTAGGRNLIDRALQKAIKEIGRDTALEQAVREEWAVDWATKKTPGRQDIVKTILNKISTCAIFVADMTLVATRADGKRKTPNPNVMVEYGYALATVTGARIITVLNAAHGKPPEFPLPFDLQGVMFPAAYNCPDNADDDVRKQQEENLAKELLGDIRLILDSAEFKKLLEPAKPEEPHPHDVRLLEEVRKVFPARIQTFLVDHNFRVPFHIDFVLPIGRMLGTWVGAAHQFHDPVLQEALDNLKASAEHFDNLISKYTGPVRGNPQVLTPLTNKDMAEDISEKTYENIRRINEAASGLSRELVAFEKVARDRIRI